MDCEAQPILRANSYNVQHNYHTEDTRSVARGNEFSKQLLPAQHLIMVLGLWHPFNSMNLCTCYNNFVSLLIWFIVMCGIIAQCFLDSFTWGKLLNSFGTVLNLCAPFLICRHYLWNGTFEELLLLVTESSPGVWRKVQKLLVMYTGVIFLMWAAGFTFFYIHFTPFFSTTYHYVFYAVVLLFSLGWWASWLGVYGFICNVHKLQIQNYILEVKETFGYSSGLCEAEENCVRTLLDSFTVLRASLGKTQKDFSKIISFCVAYHILDLVLFSIAYWKQSFGKYTLWQYAGGVLFDVFSMLFKLFPAAVVNQELHRVVKVTGDMCIPDVHTVQQFPRERYMFHQYVYTREQDLGMRILGVKITSKLTVGIFVTLTSLGLAFLYYAVPFLDTIQIT